MIQKITISLTLLLFVVSAPAAAQLNIGYVNMQEVFSQMPERAVVQQKMDSLMQVKNQEFEQLKEKFSAAANQLQSEDMTRQEMDQQEQALARLEAQIQRYPQVAQQELDQEQARLLAPLFNRITQAIRGVAEENAFDFVINETTLTGDNILFYASDTATDVTPMVVARVTGSQN